MFVCKGRAAFLLASASIAMAVLGVAGERPPNLVLIISDDQTWSDFGFMGNGEVHTPNLDRLAVKSARYPKGYVPTSVCSPSLAVLLTGRYPHQSGLHYNHPPPGNAAFNRMASLEIYRRVRSEAFRLIRESPSLPRLLGERLGFRSLQTGKFWEGHFSNAGFSEGMTLFEPVPGQAFGGNRHLANGDLAPHGNGDWGLKIGRETMEPIEKFLDERSAAPLTPWLIWYAPYLPHQPHNSPARFYDLYRDRGVPDYRLPYYASIAEFDDTVGRLVDSIERRGMAGDTLFVFVVDNGWSPDPRRRSKKRPMEFDHTRESKRAPFEDGLRSPILLRWDGVIAPRTHDEGLVSSIDLVPTLLDACGLSGEVGRLELPGISLMPTARGEAALDPSRAIFGEVYPGDASALDRPERDIAYRWMRQGRWKLIASHSRPGMPPWGGYLEGDALFDLEADPREVSNRIDDPDLAETLTDLRAQLDAWWDPDAP